MKRAPELRDLSEDHHHGLDLARRAKTAAAGDSPVIEAAWADVESVFKRELEPHFHIEETLIAPALAERGEATLVERLLREHAALRAFILPGSERTAAALQRFGVLLEEHIRFEERQLFDVAQRLLAPDALRAIATATRSKRQA